MFKEIKVHACFGEVTGYQIHASNFFPALDALVQKQKGGEGTVHISLLDVVTAAHTTERHPYPSILYNVWESTEYPAEFMSKLRLYDQMWVPSEWQRACSIAQGIPEEFVKVVPEGVNPDIYKPLADPLPSGTFNFLLVGKWEPRKSNLEICKSFLAAFPADQYPDVRLYLSCDTLFNCDQYKSTEERLEGYGLKDSRFIIVHFEERKDYIRRLQAAHIFVSCSRAEGWGLPIIESMACGIPTIVADWSGSTEYAGDAIKVRVPELKKPEGIYGGWDVPGQWGEPDYNHLTELMKDSYENYTVHKEKALKTSEYIRTQFSWVKAAEKAYKILDELSDAESQNMRRGDIQTGGEPSKMTEKDIIAYARKFGFEIGGIKKRNVIFTVDCHPTSQAKMDTLVETLTQIKGLGYPVLVSSHCALPAPIIELADYYIYDKKDILSGDDKPVYWRRDPDGKTTTKESGIPCHALAGLHNVRNAIDFCMGKYDWVYQMTSDTEIDLPEWLEKVHASDKDLICVRWENQPETCSGQIIAGKTEILDKITLRISTWEEFAKVFGDARFCSERGAYKIIKERVGLENVEFLDISVGNRFSQLDQDAWAELSGKGWKDDQFQYHFVEGPFLNITGMSNREYDVSFSNSDGTPYQLKQKVGMWSRPAVKYYRDWTMRAHLNGELKFEHKLDLSGKNVLICMGSKALGDTLAWIPYVEEFRKKHKCNVFCSSWWLDILDYPEIKFVEPGTMVEDIYASYDVGCFDGQLDKNVKDWRLTTLQQVASDILGLDYEPIRPKLKYEKPKKGNGDTEPKPYICFSEFSTMKNKLWNREGAWQKIINYLVSIGYECISVSTEKSMLQNVTSHNGQLIQDTIKDIAGAAFYVGLNAGPSWLAYALGIPCIMITGVSEPWNDFPNPHRISIDVCRPGCFNDPAHPIDRGWEWCPRKKDYACTREITEEIVIKEIEKIREEISCQLQLEKKMDMKSGRRTKFTPKIQRSKKPKPRRGSSTLLNTAGNQLESQPRRGME